MTPKLPAASSQSINDCDGFQQWTVSVFPSMHCSGQYFLKTYTHIYVCGPDIRYKLPYDGNTCFNPFGTVSE